MADQALESIVIKNRILGVLLQDARQSSGRQVTACADLLGLSEEEYRAFETGQTAPSLPQLEVLAYYFNVPIKHFWGAQTLSVAREEGSIRESLPEILMLRQRVIGASLRRLREEAGLSIADLVEKTGLDSQTIQEVEGGRQALPLTELEMLARSMSASLEDLLDSHGTVGNWLQVQSEFDCFSELPEGLRQFVSRPINRSYLELAVRLSNMDVEKLRTIAESILEITY